MIPISKGHNPPISPKVTRCVFFSSIVGEMGLEPKTSD